MATFEDALREIVAPQLQPLGYEYEVSLHADEAYGFRKALNAEANAIVQFQVRHGTPERFTVNLLREQADTRGARLSYVLWYVTGLREYPASDYWWPLNEAALRDATAKIVQYGVPWVEDAHAPKPWEMPAHNGHEFVAAVEQVLAPALQRCGYRLTVQHLGGGVPYPYFVKDWLDGTHGFIELQNVYSLDPREFQFDVRLQRRTDDDPLALTACPGVSLAQLAWQARGATLEALTVAEAKTLLWRYADRAELDAQLHEALAQIEQIGLPWIAQAIDSSK